jgi:hypothetical protein
VSVVPQNYSERWQFGCHRSLEAQPSLVVG